MQARSRESCPFVPLIIHKLELGRGFRLLVGIGALARWGPDSVHHPPRYGSNSGPWTTETFVEAVYNSLKQ